MRHSTLASLLRTATATLLVVLAMSTSTTAAAHGTYRPRGQCDGFPAAQLTVQAPMCVGVVATGLGYPRGVAVIGHDVFVTDMGGWTSHHGRLLRLSDNRRAAPVALMHGLFQPGALIRGPGRTLLLALPGRVLKIDPYAQDVAASAHVVVDRLPTTGRHPLPGLALAPDGTLYVNVGSATDNCQGADGAPANPHVACPETQEHPPRGSILRFPPRAGTWHADEQPPFARGLRNSMALAVLPGDRLVAAVNARDAIQSVDPSLPDAALPHDLLLVVHDGADYGWPYCYDGRVPSPEYPAHDCSQVPAPDGLLPAHAAPLGMIVYHGTRLPRLDGHLIVGYHGYRSTGHRLVAIAVGDTLGAPADIVSGWGNVPGVHPQGAPVGLAEADDGSVYLVEDHNGTLLRLSVVGAR